MSNITDVSDKNNIVDGYNEFELLNIHCPGTTSIEPKEVESNSSNNDYNLSIEKPRPNNYQIINIESNDNDDLQLSEDESAGEGSQQHNSSEKEYKTNSNPNDDHNDSIQSIDENEAAIEQRKPNLFIKIEEDQSVSNHSQNHQHMLVKEESEDVDETPIIKAEPLVSKNQHQKPVENRFKKLDEEISKMSYFKDIEYLTASPKEESTFFKNRFSKINSDEINIQENSDTEERVFDLSLKDSYGSTLSKELLSAIRHNAKKEQEENQSDELESFKNAHNRIINEEIKLTSSRRHNKSSCENSFDSSKPQSGRKLTKNQDSVYTFRKNTLSISIEDKQNLSISMEEEVNTKNLTKEEEIMYWKNQTAKLFEDESSIKGAIKDYGTLISDDLLTYSLTNTLKTVESLEDRLSMFSRKPKIFENNKASEEKEYNYKHHSFESSQKFSSLNADSHNGNIFDFIKLIHPLIDSMKKEVPIKPKKKDYKNKTLKVHRKSLIKPFGLISELKSEINSIINSNDSKKKAKANNVLLLLNNLQASLLEYNKSE